jgi:hypothetical protein
VAVENMMSYACQLLLIRARGVRTVKNAGSI